VGPFAPLLQFGTVRDRARCNQSETHRGHWTTLELGTACALDLGSMRPALGSIVANRFELVRELGRGAMGNVWLAEHLTLGVRCAVKFMNSEAVGGPGYVARFEREARAIARLGSTNIVRILDYDTHEGVPFIAMECFQGEDLAARLQRVGRLDAAATYSIVSQVANGLAKAHGAGIVHRDLKPENIFLAQDDEGEVVKLLDFGVAKVTGLAGCDAVASATEAGMLIGTPFYMSPEQARSVDEIDHRADLWSLAVIAFECLTGRLPFDSKALGDILAKIIFEPLPVPSQVDPVCTPEFDLWWKRAAARDPRERFAGAREMADALGRALGVVGAPTEAAPALQVRDQTARPVRPSSRRSKLLAAAVVMALAPLAVTLCSGAIDARSARGATLTRTQSVVRSADPASRSVTPPAARAEPLAASGPTAPPSAPEPALAVAAANRDPMERAAVLRSKTPTPRRAPTVSPAPPDDVDFGI
jgi:serine/threonine protein kinase